MRKGITVRSPATLRAAGGTDAGRQRDVNEDRFHVDVARGVFAVIDGVGGQAAGGKAADVALAMLRKRLERETGPTDERIREAITIANNEIYRLASSRAAWSGMGCVLTVAVVEEGTAVIGHVGDTRLYKLSREGIEKVTRDHSPVGEREDANQISEAEAMRHPRRNEVYRDVGSEPHQSSDEEFVDIQRVAFEPDSALLLCSDGLSDLVPSDEIRRIAQTLAGDPEAVVQALVDAANRAGGKDNITVVYVEGEQFGPGERPIQGTVRADRPWRKARFVSVILVVLLSVVLSPTSLRVPSFDATSASPADLTAAEIVRPTDSIRAALARARPASQVIVEPGEYREQLTLKSGVRLVSRVPRAAVIRLPANATENDPAVVAAGVTSAELVGFRIVGDAATPLGVGLLVRRSSLSILNVEVSGATKVAINFAEHSAGALLGSDIRDNPGAALSIAAGTSPRITHNAFVDNGLAGRPGAPMIIERGASPRFEQNVFLGVSAGAFGGLNDAARATLARDNWFLDSGQSERSTPERSMPATHRRGK